MYELTTVDRLELSGSTIIFASSFFCFAMFHSEP